MDPSQQTQTQQQFSPLPPPGLIGQPIAPLPQQQYVAPMENPGQTLGIVSIIMTVPLGIGIAGIILGVMSRNKSKAAGMSTTLGTVGMVLGIISTVLSVLFGIILLISFIVAMNNHDSNSSAYSTSSDARSSYTSPSATTSTSSKLSQDAKEVARRAEAYMAITGDYPKSTTDFNSYPSSTIPSDIDVYSSLLVTSKSLTYIYCGEGAAQVVYLGDSQDDKRITAVGSASTTTVCPKSY